MGHHVRIPHRSERHGQGAGSETIHETSAIWEANHKRATLTIARQKELQSLTLDGGIFVDADPSNNAMPVHAASQTTSHAASR